MKTKHKVMIVGVIGVIIGPVFAEIGLKMMAFTFFVLGATSILWADMTLND